MKSTDTNRRGRPPLGVDLVDLLPAVKQAPEEHAVEVEMLKIVLKTVTGELTLGEACDRLDLSMSRVSELRQQVLMAGLEALKPRPVGRPPKAGPSQEDLGDLDRLKQENGVLREELLAAQLREELALTMPHVLKKPQKGGPGKG